jgi:hypothetical protein
MLGKAAMMAVLLAPTASIARHDDHRTGVNPVGCFNLAASSVPAGIMRRPEKLSPDVASLHPGYRLLLRFDWLRGLARLEALLAQHLAHGVTDNFGHVLV